jgi:flavin-dependent dehydrogenase
LSPARGGEAVSTSRPIEDVTIVGGGGAGLITALTLQEREPSLDVTVLEREPEAYTTLCAEGISDKTLDLFTAFDSKPYTAETFEGARWWFPGPVEVLVDQPCYTIERSFWFPAMAEALEDRGGSYETGRKVRPEDVSELRREADLLVGADGPGSQVREALGGSGTTRLGVQVRLDADWDGDRLEFYTHKDFSPEYAWVFPKGDILNVGILGEEDGKDFQRIARFRDWLDLDGKVVRKEAYPIGFDASFLAKGNTALIGDAAGLTNPLTKGGLAAIIHSAHLLADAAEDAQEDGQKDATAAERYAERVRQHPISDPSFEDALEVMLDWDNEDFERLARFAPRQVEAGGGPIKEKLLLGLGMGTNPTRIPEIWTLYRAMALSKEYSW